MVEARYYTRLENDHCRCDTCPRGCIIKPGKHGYCLSRKNNAGRLISALYGKVAAVQSDPIEKKPLYHFMPGSSILSIGTVGCNLGCRYCQNWHLSRGDAATRGLTVQQVVDRAVQEGSGGIAYTYNEPLVWYEFVFDCCTLARERGLKNVFVTNGSLNPKPFDALLPLVDAMNIDLKGDERFYRELTDSPRNPVLRNIRAASDIAHVEVTNLLVTGQNDAPDQIEELVDFIAGVDPRMPLHFSRYFPNYKFEAAPTSLDAMQQAYAIASAKLNFVYLGNVRSDQGQDTVCPRCSTVAIRRSGYWTQVLAVNRDGCCATCQNDLNVVVAS